VRSEPPLAVGRGLSVATGAIGTLVAIGLLWLMIPHGSGTGGVAVEESSPSPPLRSSFTSAGPIPGSTNVSTTFLSASTTAHTGAAAASTDAPATTPQPSEAGTASTALPPPTTTHASSSSAAPTTAPGTTAAPRSPALAVALTPGHLVVTTAASVRGRSAVELKMTTGEKVQGSVVTVDETNNIAVVSVRTDFADPQFALSTQTGPVTAAKAMTPHDTKLDVWTDATGAVVSPDDQENPAESSIIVDKAGQLIGMCTQKETGTGLIRAEDMLSAVTAAALLEMSTWLGATVQAGPDGNLSVSEVRPGGVSAAAGLAVGDVVRMVDGAPVTTLDELRAKVLAKSPGDALTITVSRRTATTTTSTVSATSTTTTTAPTSTAAPATTSTTTSTAAPTTAPPTPAPLTLTVVLGPRPFSS
jgi:hypothetical protein